MKGKKFLVILGALLIVIVGYIVVSNMEYNNADYKLVCENDEFLLIFDNPDMYQSETIDVGSVSFSTMKEFKDTVTKGRLTDLQKRIIATAFPKNSEGAIKICDFNNMYVPKTPPGGVVSSVGWSGSTYYSFGLSLDEEVFGNLHYLTESQFNNRYQEDYLDFFTWDTITVTKTETLDDGKTATYYTTNSGEFMNVRYTLEVGTTTIAVDKTFRLQTKISELTTSATVPSSIDLYVTSEEGYCYVTLYGFSEDPTDVWLYYFGIRKFKG